MSILEKKPPQLQQKIKNAPTEPGCYMYTDKNQKIIYVGKAKNIRNRVKSYFTNYPKLDIKIQAMVDRMQDVEFKTVDSEIEALILETNLIKKYHPKYNTMMMDDKNYSWVKFEKPIKGIRDFPRIKIVREKDDLKAEYFGPYPNNLPLKNILKRVRKIFPYVSCNRKLIQISKDPLKIETNNSNPCLYFHLGLCKAPCASLQDKENYTKNFNNIKKFFRGEKVDIMRELENQMVVYSKEMEFERAAEVRDKIDDIKYVTQNIGISNDVDDVIIDELKEREREEATLELIQELGFPKDKLDLHKGFKIECYDISNIQGTNAVGAMTVMVDGRLQNHLYRKFRIRMKNEPNDFAMMQEVLGRRLMHLSPNTEKFDDSLSIKPDLIIIDGGKGQLVAAYKVLENLGLGREIPIVGLAKREEEIFKLNWQFEESEWPDFEMDKFKRIFLNRRSEALFLIKRIRDEAHRFGITYHRKLRSKQMLNKQKK